MTWFPKQVTWPLLTAEESEKEIMALKFQYYDTARKKELEIAFNW